MKSVKLTTWERLNLGNCLPTETTLSTIESLLKINGKLDLSEDEKKEVNFRVDETGNARWDDPNRTFEIHFEDAHYESLVMYANGYNRWPTSILTALLKKHLIDEVKEYDA